MKRRRQKQSDAVEIFNLLLLPFAILLRTAHRYTPSEDDIRRFYTSKEWSALSYDAMKKYGARCCMTGATADDGVRLVVDHIKPIRTHWHLRFEMSNLQILSNTMNRGKGSRCSKDWRPK